MQAIKRDEPERNIIDANLEISRCSCKKCNGDQQNNNNNNVPQLPWIYQKPQNIKAWLESSGFLEYNVDIKKRIAK